MKQTKSKLKLLYHKKLRALENRKWKLWEQARKSEEYEEIPRTLVGYMVRLELIESMRNKDEGLSEAISASTSFLRFSEKPFRLCNLKSSHTAFDRQWLSGQDRIEAIFFKNKNYQKGKLELLDITEEQYKKLSPAAKNYFTEGVKEVTRYGQYIFVYHPHIPKSYLRETSVKLYWNRLTIPDSTAESEAKKIENWMNTKRECELWHYEGCRTCYYWRDEAKIDRKKTRMQGKQELRKWMMENDWF